ncbi:MAG: hypothetical protein ACE5RC_08335 [Nitrosopumilus sp.]
MKNKVVIPIVVGVIIVMIGIISITNQESNQMEVEDTLDRELTLEEVISPEVQEKLDEIERINLENEYSPKDREWITSGPFQIDRSEYVLGEKIFLVIGGLQQYEKGQVVFLRPLNDTHKKVYQTIPFDGSKKNMFNYYIEPDISKNKGICSIDDLVGEWTVVFRGTSYENIKFRIIDEILPGDEKNYETVC